MVLVLLREGDLSIARSSCFTFLSHTTHFAPSPFHLQRIPSVIAKVVFAIMHNAAVVIGVTSRPALVCCPLVELSVDRRRHVLLYHFDVLVTVWATLWTKKHN